MKQIQLIEDKIYYCNYRGYNRYIFRNTYNSENCSNIDITGKMFFTKSGSFTHQEDLKDLREATHEETEHFLQCEKATRYVNYVPEKFIPLIFN